MAHSQDCRIRIEAAIKEDLTFRDRIERAEQRKMDFYAKEVERMDQARKTFLEPSAVPRSSSARTDVEDRSSVREAKRAREEPAQDLSGEIPIPSADETLTNPEIPLVPSGVIPSTSIPNQFSRSGVKRPYTESTTMSNTPAASSDCDAKRACSESTALPNTPVVSMGSGLKRTHEKDPANDDEEQRGSRARISTLIAGLHGVDIADYDEICNGNEVPDEWLDSWSPETHMSQKLVIEAKRKEMDRFKKMKVYRVVTRESMKIDKEGKMISIKWVITNKGTEENPIAKARLVAREFNTGDKRGELFAGTQRSYGDAYSDCPGNDETRGWGKKVNYVG